jgi:hypothetical protein
MNARLIVAALIFGLASTLSSCADDHEQSAPEVQDAELQQPQPSATDRSEFEVLLEAWSEAHWSYCSLSERVRSQLAGGDQPELRLLLRKVIEAEGAARLELLGFLRCFPDPNRLLPVVEAVGLSELNSREAFILTDAAAQASAPGFLPFALEASDHTDAQVRQRAVRLLGNIGTPSAVLRLQALASEDGSDAVRAAAREVLVPGRRLPPHLEGLPVELAPRIDNVVYDATEAQVTISVSVPREREVFLFAWSRAYEDTPPDRILDVDAYLVPVEFMEQTGFGKPRPRRHDVLKYGLGLGPRQQAWVRGVRVHGMGLGVRELRF